ncbi:MAG: hypothetical protein LBB13_02755, partial [Rickettsiales bacterium]|nr:hypothetical protein [Rickettsiales bacterium]
MKNYKEIKLKMKNQKLPGSLAALTIIFVWCNSLWGAGANVNSFKELKSAIATRKTPINFLTDNIVFENNLSVDYNLELFGKINGTTKLNGGNSPSLFSFTAEATTVLINSIEFSGNSVGSDKYCSALHIAGGGVNYRLRNSNFNGNDV